MRLSNVLGLYLARLRHRWPQELLAILGIAAGIALLYASSVANTSLAGPVKQLARGVAGNSQLQLIARSPDGLPVSLAAPIREIPGVRTAAPVLEAPATLVGPRGRRALTFYAGDPRVVRLRGTLLRGFTDDEAASQDTIAIPTRVARSVGLRFGDDAQLHIAGATHPVAVATVGTDQIGKLANNALGLAPLAYLQQLARMDGRATRILVEAEPAALDDVRTRLRLLAGTTADVRPADYDARLFATAVAPTSQATTISSTVSALIGFLFAICAMLVSMGARRALAVDLRLDGYRPRQVLGILLVDAFVLAAVAIVVGLAAGEAISRGGYGADVDFLAGAFPIGSIRVVTWPSFAIAIAGGLVAAIGGVLLPVWRLIFARVPQVGQPPTTEPARPGRRFAGHRLTLAGLALLAVSVTVTVLAPGAAVLALVALVGALVLLVPAVLSGAVWLLDWCSRHTPRLIAPLELALPSLRAQEWASRSIAITTIGAVAVFGGVALQGARSNLQAGLEEVSTEMLGITDLWVAPDGPGSLFGTDPFRDQYRQRIAAVEGVRHVGLYRAALLDVDERRTLVLAPPRTAPYLIPPGQVRDGDLADATARVRAGGWATLSEALAEHLHLRVGDRFVLPTPRARPLRLAAITTNFGWSGGSIVLNADDAAALWNSPSIGAYLVEVESGADPAMVQARLARTLGPRAPLRIETPAARHERQSAVARDGLERLRQIALMTLIAAVLAMGAATAALLWQRRASVSRQKLDGHRTGRMWATLAIEAATLFVTGAFAGAIAGLLGQLLFSRALASIMGFPVQTHLRPGIAALTFALVTLVALAVVAVPGYVVARTRPSLTIRD
ncbi:ABC transporter permease [Patulibacter defluvii]|uniref:ABC transporter permease n=1 Tax=Patulibacter defluvii TaxID=3095358 RepID=UPI002A751AD9|nr:FtsX-like permease family protein [Patulibacter sp. DM4]